jgi:hypothetical protein
MRPSFSLLLLLEHAPQLEERAPLAAMQAEAVERRYLQNDGAQPLPHETALTLRPY